MLCIPTTVLVYADPSLTARKNDRKRGPDFASLPISMTQCIMDALETQAPPDASPFRPDRQVNKWAFGFIAPIAGDDSTSKRSSLENAGFVRIVTRACKFRWRASCRSMLLRFDRHRTERPQFQPPRRRRQQRPDPRIPSFSSQLPCRPANRPRVIRSRNHRIRSGMFVLRQADNTVQREVMSCGVG